MQILGKKLKIVAVGLGALLLISLFMSSVRAQITFAYPNEFFNPLGPSQSWSFESTGYWSSNYGGYISSSYKLHLNYSWRAIGSSSGNYQMWRNVESSCLNALKGKSVVFSFFFLPVSWDSQGSLNNARAVVTVYATTGTYYYYGEWIKPVEFKWHNAHVRAYVSSYATSVKVTIEGSTTFNAWIDVASFAIRDFVGMVSDKGELTFNVNLYEWRIMQGAEYDGRVFIVPALFAESNTARNYFIRAIKIYIELLPLHTAWRWWPPGYYTYTSQQGQLNIEYLGQGNNWNHQVDPAATEAFQNTVLEAAEIAIDFGVGIGFAFVSPASIAESILVATTGTGIATGAKYLLRHFASDPNDRYAYGGEDYSAHEQWDYPTFFLENHKFVSSCTGHLQFQWMFKSGSAESFQIKIVAYVNWGLLQFTPGSPRYGTPDKYSLADVGWESLQALVTVNA